MRERFLKEARTLAKLDDHPNIVWVHAVTARAGEIHSLQSALLDAGARSATTSLWPVSDEPTAELMGRFYTKLWRDSLGKADALWQAKVAMREGGYPMRDWAGWVLTGDPD